MTQRIYESKRWKLSAWLILPWDQLRESTFITPRGGGGGRG